MIQTIDPDREISLMFSGGVDSTMTAILLAREHRKVHLLTYANGYGHYHIQRTGRRIEELRRIVGDRFIHTIRSTKDLFDLFVMGNLKAEYKRYGSGFIWCMGCKMAMHTQSILYNLENGISMMSDGSSGSSDEMVEQMRISIELVREFYAEYGIDYQTPVYEITREEEIRTLKEMGVRMGFRVGDRFLGVQPKCRPGEIYYLPYLLFGQPPKHEEEKVAEFIREKRKVAREYIEHACASRGIPIPGRSDKESVHGETV